MQSPPWTALALLAALACLASSDSGANKGRALSQVVASRSNNLTGQGEPPLDDVSMDEDPPELCVHGERIEQGCDQVCTCAEGRLVCVSRCPPPLVPASPPPQDPDCHHKPTPDHCCATLVCTHSLGSDQGDCIYKNESYKYGETFNDSCTGICQCGENGQVTCTPRCPPSNRTVSTDRCLSVKDTKDPCCTVLYCDVNEENGSQEDLMQLKLLSAVPANSSTIVLNFDKPDEIDKIIAETSFDKISWSSAKTNGHVVTGLTPGKTYFFRAIMDGVQSNVVSAILPSLAVNSSVCEFKGKTYKKGEEFHDGCVAYCFCGKSGVECATIECPTDFGLDVLDPTCLTWETQPPDFLPTPPNCCPQSLSCKDNGSCIYHGERFENWEDIPDKLTGCEQKCYCETGNVTCRPRCPPVPEKPPSDLVCPPNMAILTHPLNDNCCLHWMCPSHSGGDVNATTIPNTKINSTQKSIVEDSFIPFPGPLNPNNSQFFNNQELKHEQISPSSGLFSSLSENMGKNSNVSQISQVNGPYVIPLSPEHNEKTSLLTKHILNSEHDVTELKSINMTKSDEDINSQKHRNMKEKQSTYFEGVNSTKTTTGIENQVNSVQPNATNTHTNSQSTTPNDNMDKYSDIYQNVYEESVHENQHNFMGETPFLYAHASRKPPNQFKNIQSDFHAHETPAHFVPTTQFPKNELKPVLQTYNKPTANFNNLVLKNNKQISPHEMYGPLQKIQLSNPNEPIPHNVYHVVHTPQPLSGPHRVPSQYLSPEELYLIENQDRLPTNPKQIQAIYPTVPQALHPNLKKETIHIHSPTIPTGLRLEDIIEQIRQHEATDSQTKDAHVVLLGAQPPNLNQGISPSHSLPGYPNHPQDSNGITVHTLEAINENTVRLVFSVPPVLVGLHGQVELRYTADNKNSDPSTWEQQVLAPPNDLIATPELEFELGGLHPNTEYKIKITVVMRGLRNSPASQILLVRTPGAAIPSTTLPPVIPVEPELHVAQLNSTWATLAWRKFTEFELQFIDGVQLRFKELDGKVYQATPLIHRAVTSYTIEDLKPESQYEVGIFFIPFPGQLNELQAQKTIKISTTIEKDPYRFELMLEVHHIKASSVEVTWSGVPYPEDKYVNIFRIIYQSEGGRQDMNSFKVAKRDSPASTLVQVLKPDTRYRLWLEAYLTNGRIKKSNVKDFTTKHGAASTNETYQGKLEGTPLVETSDYYGPLVGVSILAAMAIIAAVAFLLLLAKKHGHNKAPITSAVQRKPAAHTAAYDNPSYKVETQHETMDL